MKQRAKRTKRNKSFVNLDSVKSIGIIYKHRDKRDLQSILKIKEDFLRKNINVSIVGWVSSKDLPSYLVTSDIGFFFNQKELSFSLIPKSDFIKEFVKNEFDILLNLDVASSFVLNYITALSHAKMKVGRQNEEIKDYLEFMISLKENEISIDQIYQQVSRYLSLIKTTAN